jgi:hypothetical protein
MVRSVGLYLTRFDEQPELPPEASDLGLVEQDAEYMPEFPTEQPISEETRQTLIEEGRAAAKAEFNDILEQERQEFLQRLEAERNSWASEEGNRLSEQFCSAIQDLTTNLESNLEQILEPFVVQSVRRKMLSSLIEQLRSLLADRDHPVIQLSGPMDLLEVVCTELNNADLATVVTEVGGIDVKARLETTLIETSIQEWLQRLQGGD